RRRERARERLRRNIVSRPTLEGALACQQFIEHNPQVVDVRSLVDGRIMELFGGHVFWRSPRLLRSLTLWAPNLAGEAKVSERCLSLAIEKDISGLDVPMNQPVAVR